MVDNNPDVPIERPDFDRPSRLGGHPDFIFEDSKKQTYVLELTRLLTPQLRSLEKTVSKRICIPVGHLLPGTFVLHIRLTDPLGRGRISPRVLNLTAQEIATLAQHGDIQDVQQLDTGFVLRRVKNDGNKLVPWITSLELPFDLTDAHPVAGALRTAFQELVLEADRKFCGYNPYRILIIGTSQSGLNLEFHAGRYKDGQGILLTWIAHLSLGLANTDAILLEPGINVWSTGGKVMAGHKYIDNKAGYYRELWRRPGVPHLLA